MNVENATRKAPKNATFCAEKKKKREPLFNANA